MPADNSTPLAQSRDASALGSTPGKYIAIYYGIACGIGWILWAPLVLGQDGLRLLSIAPPAPVVICLGTLGPLLACYLTHRLQMGNWRAVRLFPREVFRLLWLVLAPLLVLFCFFVVFPALISKGGPKAWHWHPVVLGGIFVPMFNYNLFGGPLFLLRSGWITASPFSFVLILIGLSLVMAYGFNASGKAVVAAILMHSAFNSSSRFLDGYLKGVATREHPAADFLLAASFLIAGVVLGLVTRGRLGTDKCEPVAAN